MLRDIGVIRSRPDVFDINADVGLIGDGDEGEIGRMREIEGEPVGEFRANVRLAECIVDKPNSARFDVEIAPQEVAQHAVRGNETPLIALESKTRTPPTFLRREGQIETSACLGGKV